MDHISQSQKASVSLGLGYRLTRLSDPNKPCLLSPLGSKCGDAILGLGITKEGESKRLVGLGVRGR
jgi:hypothetical protein